ncbi:MAG: glycosyltransferase family 4 protein, partial [Leptolyngbya sp. SIO3F4]|nr:glycosyltransferase family 4 protein [Leptolyngbya sp. SIO3F4]
IIETSPNLDSSERYRDRNDRQLFWLRGLRKYYERYWRYPRSLKNIKADIFHVIDHSEGHLNFWLKRNQKASVVTCHDLINLVRPETFKGLARLPTVSMWFWKTSINSMRNAERIIAVSSHTKKDIVKSLNIDASSVDVIPNAVEPIFRVLPESYSEQIRAQHGIKHSDFCILNVGSNHSRKNVSGILKALKILNEKGIPVHFWKVGKDFNDEQLIFIHEHQLEKNVTFLGQPEIEDLIAIYNAADVLVAPSFYEGFGLTVLEAMACGLPVITSNVTSLPEVVGDAAVLVNPEDIQLISLEIQNFFEDPVYRQKFSHKGLKRVTQFTWKNTAEYVASIYEKTLSKG